MKLLIIEDDLMIARSLANFFKTNNYIVDIANDGETGMVLANNTDYDLIIIDFLLPKMNGQTLTAHLRKSGRTMPILAISVCDAISDKAELLDRGADDYLVKPFFFAELHARVKALLRRQRKNDTQILSFADLTLNLANNEAIRGGRRIYLTTKEFFLLRLFMEKPGLIVSRQAITEKVWDDASHHLSNTIEALILKLRQKIDFKKPFLIHTVPGRGYKLNIDS